MNPFGLCHHTHYEGGPVCVHAAYDVGYDEGLQKAVTVINDYIDDTVQHVASGIGLCAPLAGDRCDITAALRAARNRVESVAYDLEHGIRHADNDHDPLCPSHYTFTACECALIRRVRLDEATKSAHADISVDVGGN